MNIRPFDYSDRDYEAIVAVNNASFPESPRSVEAAKSWDEVRDPKYFHQRLVAEQDGQIVGVGDCLEPHWTYKPGKYFIFVQVHPDCRQQGIGTALYGSILETLVPKRPSMLTSETRANQPDAIKFLEKRGYQMVQRQPISRLDVASFDPSRFRSTIERFEASGLCIYTASELQRMDKDYWPKMHKLDALVMTDVPMPEPYTQPDLDRFIKIIEDPQRGYNPDSWFVAVVPTETGIGEYVGLSCLWNDIPGSSKKYTGLTGVVREYRRKGVATAMKVRAIEYAKSVGATVIETDNEENNPMFQLNVALGFREVTAFLEYQKQLS